MVGVSLLRNPAITGDMGKFRLADSAAKNLGKKK